MLKRILIGLLVTVLLMSAMLVALHKSQFLSGFAV